MGFLSWAYRKEPYPPFWGPQTSKSNFCEQDYILTTYIAEVINTVTNLTYLCYAFYGIRLNTKRHDAFLRNLPYLGIAGVGLGSALFHTTLKNYTQWMDDLSMLIATATVLHRVFTFDKSLKTTVISGIAATVSMALFIAWHCITDEVVMHPILFGIMIAIVGIKTRSIISQRVSNLEVRKEVTKLVTWGGVTFVTGFILWNIDNIYCPQLTKFKRKIGMPWSFIFELHGWWHIFTGIGAYTFIALVEYLTSIEAGSSLGSRFAWPVGKIVNKSAGEEKEVDPAEEGLIPEEGGVGYGTSNVVGEDVERDVAGAGDGAVVKNVDLKGNSEFVK